MTLLYIFPHPDDESFGPGPAIARQVRQGHAVSILTLTRGGATKVRHGLGLSVDEMGDVRANETRRAAAALGAALTLLDFPDGGLDDLDPRELERAVTREIEAVRPDVVVTYVGHGNSVHPDHLVAHAVVKRAYCAARDATGDRGPRRLAFFSLVEEALGGAPSHLRGVPRDALDALVTPTDADRQRGHAALACYETYAAVVAEHRPLDSVAGGVGFVLFQEAHDPPLGDLTDGLDAG